MASNMYGLLRDIAKSGITFRTPLETVMHTSFSVQATAVPKVQSITQPRVGGQIVSGTGVASRGPVNHNSHGTPRMQVRNICFELLDAFDWHCPRPLVWTTAAVHQMFLMQASPFSVVSDFERRAKANAPVGLTLASEEVRTSVEPNAAYFNSFLARHD